MSVKSSSLPSSSVRCLALTTKSSSLPSSSVRCLALTTKSSSLPSSSVRCLALTTKSSSLPSSSVRCLALTTKKRQKQEQKACFDFLYNFCLKHVSLQEEMSEIFSKLYIGLHVNYPLFLSDFNQT